LVTLTRRMRSQLTWLFAVCVCLNATVGCSKPRSDGTWVTTEISEVGGTITVPGTGGGQAIVTAPAGRPLALSGRSQSSGIVGVSDIYTFGPEGQTFDRPLEIAITLALDSKVDLGAAWVGTRQRADQPWERLETTGFDLLTRTIRAKVLHFSSFAVFSESAAIAGRGDQFDAAGIRVETSSVVDLLGIVYAAYTHLVLIDAPFGLTLRLRGLLADQRYYVYRDTLSAEPEILRTDADGGLEIVVDAF
jgi:hypothetical protein